MPLPDANDPKKSNLYSQLRSSQVGSVSQTNFDLVKDPVFLNAEWEDEARRLKLWGELSGKSSGSGPLAGTGKIETFSQSVSSGTTYDVWTASAGEVWELVSADYSATLSSGQLDSIQLKIKASSTECLVAENATNDSYDTFKDLFGSTIYLDENMTVAVRPNDANLTALTVNLLLIRVR